MPTFLTSQKYITKYKLRKYYKYKIQNITCFLWNFLNEMHLGFAAVVPGVQ